MKTAVNKLPLFIVISSILNNNNYLISCKQNHCKKFKECGFNQFKPAVGNTVPAV